VLQLLGDMRVAALVVLTALAALSLSQAAARRDSGRRHLAGSGQRSSAPGAWIGRQLWLLLDALPVMAPALLGDR
jgi:hypothetical protein